MQKQPAPTRRSGHACYPAHRALQCCAIIGGGINITAIWISLLNNRELQQVQGFTSQRARNRLVHLLRERGISNERVLAIIAETPRHLFVDEALAPNAYADTALPIGHAQTISQPYIVARMTSDLLGEASSLDSVLEIGTGCGYQAAVLAQLVRQVYSLERIRPLLDDTRRRLRQTGYRNITLRHGDGSDGWPEHAPYAGILVTAAARVLPENLAQQLQVGGRLVIPIGDETGQTLYTFVRKENGLQKQANEPVRFVPLLRGTT